MKNCHESADASLLVRRSPFFHEFVTNKTKKLEKIIHYF